MAAPVVPSYHHHNLRAAILETSLQLIEEKGLSSLTLREIGTRLGVSRTAAYRHFSNKDEILAAVSEQGFREFGAALSHARNLGKDFRSRMTAMAVAYQRFAAEHRAHYAVMFGWATSIQDACEVWHAAAEESFEILARTIREGQFAGEVRTDRSAITLARVVWASSHGLAVLNLEPDLSPEGPGTRLALDAAEVLCTGLRPDTAQIR